jgi:hypothetical protein
MPTIKGDGITGENFPHQIPKGSITCTDQQMDMVGRQHPCITSAASQRKILFKSTKKVVPVAVVKKDILAIQTPGNDMMNPSPKSHKYSGIRGLEESNIPPFLTVHGFRGSGFTEKLSR